jgi:hypothetical protein
VEAGHGPASALIITDELSTYGSPRTALAFGAACGL